MLLPRVLLPRVRVRAHGWADAHARANTALSSVHPPRAAPAPALGVPKRVPGQEREREGAGDVARHRGTTDVARGRRAARARARCAPERVHTRRRAVCRRGVFDGHRGPRLARDVAPRYGGVALAQGVQGGARCIGEICQGRGRGGKETCKGGGAAVRTPHPLHLSHKRGKN